MRKYEYRVQCKVCGWEGYTLLRGYHSSFYYIECPNCGSRVLFAFPPDPNKKIKISFGFSDLLVLGMLSFLLDAVAWAWAHRRGLLLGLSGFSVSLLLATLLLPDAFLGLLISAVIGGCLGVSADRF